MSAVPRIGFMQGRLSPLVDSRIQAFPWEHWQREFGVAAEHGFGLMEWIVDQARLYENPLLTVAGRTEIADLCRRHGVSIPSLTGDCFKQAPFWKVRGEVRARLERDFLAVADACATMRMSSMMLPLVDEGRLENDAQEDALVGFLCDQRAFLATHGLQVTFESDHDAGDVARFIDRLDPAGFGITYDIGDRAALGCDPTDDIAAFGARIRNVHVKDRVRGGGTVPLGTGDADFAEAFAALHRIGYRGSYILQGARAADDDHVSVLCRYRDMTLGWLRQSAEGASPQHGMAPGAS